MNCIFSLLFFLLFVSPVWAQTEGGVVSDTHTEIRFLTFHAHAATSEDPMLRRLIFALDRPSSAGQVRWLVLAQGEKEITEIKNGLRYRGIPDQESRLHFLNVRRPLNPWARDLYVFFQTPEPDVFNVRPMVPHPKISGADLVEQMAQSTWFGMHGFRAISHAEEINRPLWTAGGDIASDEAYLYAGLTSVERMIQKDGLKSPEEAAKSLQNLFGKEVIVLPGPDPHQDRYHIPLGILNGKRTSLLADPIETLRLLADLPEQEKKDAVELFVAAYLEKGEVLRKDLERFFAVTDEEIETFKESSYVRSLDEVEKTLLSYGIRVLRIPTLHRFLTQDHAFPVGFYYVNLIQDYYEDWQGNPRRKVILPEYGIPGLDGKVRQILKGLEGIDEVRMVRAIREGFLGAGIRCLVQIAGREMISHSSAEEVE